MFPFSVQYSKARLYNRSYRAIFRMQRRQGKEQIGLLFLQKQIRSNCYKKIINIFSFRYVPLPHIFSRCMTYMLFAATNLRDFNKFTRKNAVCISNTDTSTICNSIFSCGAHYTNPSFTIYDASNPLFPSFRNRKDLRVTIRSFSNSCNTMSPEILEMRTAKPLDQLPKICTVINRTMSFRHAIHCAFGIIRTFLRACFRFRLAKICFVSRGIKVLMRRYDKFHLTDFALSV